jgi:hypothetical protein
MSGCSKEYIETPEPETQSSSLNSNLREGIGILASKLPYLASTGGSTGLLVYPNGWKRGTTTSNNSADLPTGSSSLTHLFGKAASPWEKNLAPLPTVDGGGAVLTVTSRAGINGNDPNNPNKRSSVITKIEDLEPGKLYKFTVYGSSTVCKVAQNGYQPGYARKLTMRVFRSQDANDIVSNQILMFGSFTNWLPCEIMFKAKEKVALLELSAYTESDDRFTYGHFFVGKNSIKKLD